MPGWRNVTQAEQSAKDVASTATPGSTFTHYIIVRRDLPFGVMLAMVAHAAGESYQVAIPSSSVKERPREAHSSGEVGGSSPPSGAKFEGPVAVVMGARNEGKLRGLRVILVEDEVKHVAICEPDAPYHGQLMAIGLPPQPREQVEVYLRAFQMIRVEDCPVIMQDEL